MESVQDLLDGIDEVSPGPELAARLAGLDRRDLTGHQEVVVLKAALRMASHYQGRVYRSMNRVWEIHDGGKTSDDPEADFNAAAQEIRAALRLTRRAASQELSNAIDFFDRLPQVGEAFLRGAIDQRRARIFAHATGHLPESIAQLVVHQTMLDAPRLTSGELLAVIRRIAIKVEPESAQKQYEDELADRRIFGQPNPSGTANLLGMNLAPDRVQAALNRVNEHARELRRSGDKRTMDQLRADIALDLLAGHPLEEATKGRGMVDIRVDLATLARLSDEPGDLAGYGPIIADIARQAAEAQPDSEWRFAISDDSGEILVDGITRRRPSAELRRRVETRTPTCIFPGCRMPASQSDLDHRVEWAKGGTTDKNNLDPDCRFDHVIRHREGWTFEPIENGDYLWTSPFGHRYTTSGRPPPQAA